MRNTSVVLTAVAVCAAAAGALAAALAAARRTVDAAAVTAALAVAGMAGLAAAVVLSSGRLNHFGQLHLLYLGLVVTLPLVGLALLALSRWRGARPVAVLSSMALLVPAPVGWYATHVEPYWLRVDRVEVPVAAARAGDDAVRIGVLADLQTNEVGRHERRAIDRLLGARPDVILLPGDLFQGDTEEYAATESGLRALLRRLDAPHGVWFVRGDVDVGDRADRLLAGTRVRIVDDEVVDVRVGDRLLRIGGHRLDYLAPGAARVRDALAATARADGSIRILLAHRPDTVLPLPASSRVDLTVAGHTHGGQFVVPFVGPIITLTDVPRHVARGGLHRVNGNAIYVSPGVGLERSQAPQLRFLSRPAIAVLELRDVR